MKYFLLALFIISSCGQSEKTGKDSLRDTQSKRQVPGGQTSHAQVPSSQSQHMASTSSSTFNAAPKNIDLIIAHQNKRFKYLADILDKDPKYRIKFPGRSAQKHALGTGIAAGSWLKDDHQKMIANISAGIKDLEDRYPGRIQFGFIGDFKFDSTSPNCDRSKQNETGLPGLQTDKTFVVHVWGANASNFNLDNGKKGPWGSGQATCFDKQRPGVFGISTMPGGAEAELLADDKLWPLY